MVWNHKERFLAQSQAFGFHRSSYHLKSFACAYFMCQQGISSIRMPFLDGLELILIVKKLHPDIYCVLLTSYAEFEYARQAIELGAFSYIIKPIDIAEFQKILTNIKEDYQKRDSRNQYVSKLELYIKQLEDFNHNSPFPAQARDENVMDLGEAYILKHYCEKDFSLSSVAQHIGFETTYFSKLFKQKYKIGFLDYIISLRIEKAKRLLSTGLYTASAVCEMIGYENYPYFSSLLKKGRNFTQQILREFEKEAFIKNR